MKIQGKIANFIKKISILLWSVNDGDYEIYREEFESDMSGRLLERNKDNTYVDPEVRAAWVALCKSKVHEILRIW